MDKLNKYNNLLMELEDKHNDIYNKIFKNESTSSVVIFCKSFVLNDELPTFQNWLNFIYFIINKLNIQTLIDKEKGACSICLCNIVKNNDYIMCYQCKNPLHLNCANDWLIIKGDCPNCRANLFAFPLNNF
jgi:hypothetical protein